jgi:hypothetical protein
MPYKDPEKQREAQRRHYQANKADIIARSAWQRRASNDKLKELKGSPCLDCNVSYPHYVMHFDHIGGDKVADVSRLVRSKSWQAVLDEISKCELICSNCHAERTWQRLQEQA